MGMPVAELLSRISSKELSEWMIFYNIEPFGFEAEYLGHAQTSATLVNINKKKGSKTVSAKDFMPEYKLKSNGDISGAVSLAATVTTMHGGEVKSRGSS